ncbi:hypothetical protein GCM10027405_29510 [Arthrobacter alkaliphilus]|uniref:hypothetical protein n=1 Tax=Arthrobacter alkaliphilus TaxID=369936 RepID=UPI001F424532|nr:hypothetical protein [Arthrobacter alkaliphilus]
MNTAVNSGQDPLMEPSGPPGNHGRATAFVLRVLAAAALAVDAVVHVRFAPGYQSAAPEGLGEGNLFLVEAAAAGVTGLYVLIRGSRPAWVFTLIIAGGGLAVLLLYRYIDIPAVGPFPAMYEPIWFFDKTLTAIAQTAAVLLAATALTLHRPGRRKTHHPSLPRGRNRGHDDK